MSDPRAFISFDADHNVDEKVLFAGQAKHSKTPFNIEDWSSKTSLPQAQWQQIIHDKINRSNMVIVLVGQSMGSASGVDKEIAFADANDVPVFGVYVDRANSSSTLPTGLQRNRVIKWEWEAIAKAIDQMMTEGKNK